ncbi:rubredoxin-like domain-containing protein [Planctomycetota bacterium]
MMSPKPVKQWRCLVCGYIHEGLEPPDVCPLCSAGKDQFVPVEGKTETSEARWQCQVCGYIHVGECPPESCPLCGAPADRFGEMRADAS